MGDERCYKCNLGAPEAANKYRAKTMARKHMADDRKVQLRFWKLKQMLEFFLENMREKVHATDEKTCREAVDFALMCFGNVFISLLETFGILHGYLIYHNESKKYSVLLTVFPVTK